MKEIVERFDLSRVNRANAVFDAAKLEWINAQHLQRMGADQLAGVVGQWLLQVGLAQQAFAEPGKGMQQAVQLLRSRCKTLHDFSGWGRAFFVDDFEIDPAGQEKYLADPAIFPVLQDLADRYGTLEEFSLESTEQVLRELALKRKVKPGALIGAARVALTGNPVAPGLFEVIVYLGKQRTVERLRRAAALA